VRLPEPVRLGAAVVEPREARADWPIGSSVRGTVANETDQELHDVRVALDVLDAQGAVITTVYADVGRVAPGRQRRFTGEGLADPGRIAAVAVRGVGYRPGVWAGRPLPLPLTAPVVQEGLRVEVREARAGRWEGCVVVRGTVCNEGSAPADAFAVVIPVTDASGAPVEEATAICWSEAPATPDGVIVRRESLPPGATWEFEACSFPPLHFVRLFSPLVPPPPGVAALGPIRVERLPADVR